MVRSKQQGATSAAPRDTPLIVASVSAAVLLLWLPYTIRLVAIQLPDEPKLLYLFDIPNLALMLAWSLHKLPLRPLRGFSTWSRVVGFLSLAAVVATCFGPDLGGWLMLYRFIGAIVLGCFLAELHRDDRTLVIIPLILTTVVQALLAIAQKAAGRDLGLGEFGERLGLFTINETVTPLGTFYHPYWLSALCCLGTALLIALAFRHRRIPLMLLAGLTISPLGLTLSRASLLAVIPLLALVMLQAIRDHKMVPLLLALSVGFGGSAALTADGWLGRVDESLSPTYDTNGSGVGGRLMLARETIQIIAHNPLLGVGPGYYQRAAEKQLGDQYSGEIGHSAPLLLTAELGIPAGLAVLLLLVAAGRRAFGAGAAGVCIFLSYLPLVLLDAFPYSRPQGVVLTAVWLGSAWSWDASGRPQGGTRIPMEIGWPRRGSNPALGGRPGGRKTLKEQGDQQHRNE